jgi:hypothetical protein
MFRDGYFAIRQLRCKPRKLLTIRFLACSPSIGNGLLHFGSASAISQTRKEAVKNRDLDPLPASFSTRPEPLLQQERHLFLPTLIPANCLFRKMAPENGAIFLRESWGRSLESTWILNV